MGSEAALNSLRLTMPIFSDKNTSAADRDVVYQCPSIGVVDIGLKLPVEFSGGTISLVQKKIGG